MTSLSKVYGLSDVGLRKICKKLLVPLPPRGYWARKRRSNPPALPPSKGPFEHVIQKWVEPKLELTNGQKSQREMLIEKENTPQQRILVSENIETLHHLASKTLKQLRKAAMRKNITDQSWVNAGSTCLDICVSPSQIDRAIVIMNSLLTGLEARKFSVKIENGRTCVDVLGEKFRVNIEEASSRIDHKPTPLEIKQQIKSPWMKSPSHDHIPSGKLSLKIEKGSYRGLKTWNDGKKQRIENCLNSFIIGLIESAFKEKSRRAESERHELERQERERIRTEKVKLIHKEKERLVQLEAETDQWQRSQQIRAYIDAVQKEKIESAGAIDPEGNLAKWIIWATQQADRLDPLKENPPSVLDEEDKYLRSYW